MTERRFNEDEVAAIFEEAAEAQHTPRRQLASAEGMTLAELQEIGREVGIPPELVAQAARSVAQGQPAPAPRFLGLPLGVGRTVEFGRKLTDEEWELLVVDLRETFDARGTVRYDGPFRQWTNGNLQALLEPTVGGHRLRLKTVNGSARGLIGMGLTSIAGAGVVLIAGAVAGSLFDPGVMGITAMLSVMGISAFGAGALRLPRWAGTRRRQMDAVAARLTLAVDTPPSLAPPDGD